MNPSRQLLPPIPAALPERDRAAFAVYDLLAAEVRAAGWTLLVRLVGFGAGKRAVLELRRGTATNVRALKEYATWRAEDGLWTVAGRAPVYAVTAGDLAALVRAAVAGGFSERLPSHELDRPADRERVPAKVRRGKNLCLHRDAEGR